MRRAHRAEAMRHKLDNYQQVILPPDASVTVNNNKNFWLEKARGFIERKSEGLSKATEDK
ncbi:MAG: hypothetical protein EOP48_34615 [Sphingobacteriales bacterium]|nr:MAG: hypothetical protein EOP48_34615 [Sphingobacteriales bacterium]